MSGLAWLLGLSLILAVLFLIALLKPIKPKTPTKIYNHSSNDLQALYHQLIPLLSSFRLISKTGTQNRILVYKKSHHIATIILSTDKPTKNLPPFTTRMLGDVMILQIYTNYTKKTIWDLVSAINHHHNQQSSDK